MVARSYKSDRPINITRIDKVQEKCDCILGPIVNGIRDPILYSFALDQPPSYKIYKEPKVKHFERINKPILSLIHFYIEDDDYKPVDFNGATISFTSQPKKI